MAPFFLLLNNNWVAKRVSEVPFTGEQLCKEKFPVSYSKIKWGETSKKSCENSSKSGENSVKSGENRNIASGETNNDGWLPAVVPGTVLTTLVKNGVFPDPFYGLNNELIPDIGAVGRGFYTFWFCTKFSVPSGKTDSRVWLHFRGINYSSELYVNGISFPLKQPRGMFLRRHVDVTEAAKRGGSANSVAMVVYPPDHVGKVEGGGQGGDHDIAKDVTAQYVEGWDWIVPIRDRNTGIWDEVAVKVTGPVVIRDPHLVSTFTDSTLTTSFLHISTQLQNSSLKRQKGNLKISVSLEIEDDICLIHGFQSEEFEMEAKSEITHTIKPMKILNPQLWWPNGLGSQPLYSVEISVEIEGFGESDSWTERFGFREILSTIDPKTRGRIFKVNGQPVFIRGGNWIVSDGMLRFSKERYRTEIDFHADANLNMIRVWGGALAERPEFYDACDERGILVWQEFWITGDCNGRGIEPSDPNWPLDHILFLECARDTVKLLRNHPSLALWVGGNETTPSPDLNRTLISDLRLNNDLRYRRSEGTFERKNSKTLFLGGDLRELRLKSREGKGSQNGKLDDENDNEKLELEKVEILKFDESSRFEIRSEVENETETEKEDKDPSLLLDGTRPYIQGSLWDGFGEGSGDWSDGPYNILDPKDYFSPGFYKWGFNPEIGNVGVPEASTIRSTFPPEFWDPPEMKILEGGEVEEIPNRAWDYHTYIPYSKPGLVRDQICMYGFPVGLDDFCEKAQVVNFVQYKSLLESWNSGMWNQYSGVLIWKTQNPWPGLRGQLYDCQLDIGGGLMGVRGAAERRHVQMNLETRFVEIVNSTVEKMENFFVRAAIYNLDGSCPDHSTFAEIFVDPFTTARVFQVPDCTCMGASDVYFLLLSLHTKSGVQISRNFYWLYAENGDYTPLAGEFREKKVKLGVELSGKRDSKNNFIVLNVKLKNGSSNLLINQESEVCTKEFKWSRVEKLREENLREEGESQKDEGREGRQFDNKMDKEVGEMAKEIKKRPQSVGENEAEAETNRAEFVLREEDEKSVAFFVRLSVLSRDPFGGTMGDGRILGTRYSDNYVSLVPGESMELEIKFREKEKLENEKKETFKLSIRGWNVETFEFPIDIDSI